MFLWEVSLLRPGEWFCLAISFSGGCLPSQIHTHTPNAHVLTCKHTSKHSSQTADALKAAGSWVQTVTVALLKRNLTCCYWCLCVFGSLRCVSLCLAHWCQLSSSRKIFFLFLEAQSQQTYILLYRYLVFLAYLKMPLFSLFNHLFGT